MEIDDKDENENEKSLHSISKLEEDGSFVVME